MNISRNIKHTVGQHFFVGFHGKEMTEGFRDFLCEWLPGGIIYFTRNIGGYDQLRELNTSILEVYRREGAAYAPFIGTDMEGGRVARLKPPFQQFPSALTLAEEGEEAVYVSTKKMVHYLKELGFSLDFLPLLDVLTADENDVIGNRAYGRSPEVVTKMAGQVFSALSDEGVMGCAKHFPGHGMTRADSHKELPVTDISPEELERVHLSPYRSLIAGGKVDMVMTAHVLYSSCDSFPGTFSERLLRGVLRNSLGYKGIIITDDLEMLALPRYLEKEGFIKEGAGIQEQISTSVRLGMEAGNDMLLICNNEEAITAGLKGACDMYENLQGFFSASSVRINSIKKRFHMELNC